ncbi:MAG: hypothetical protein HC819_19530 [Cyclobacteriaceae bacterium]|nr:hypothetical protein [Cyclobacteriaceae bacterium]
MRFYFNILTLILFSCNLAYSQQNGQLFAAPGNTYIEYELANGSNQDFSEVDDFITRTNGAQYASPAQLAVSLAGRFESEAGKIRAIYTWIALNVAYDHQALITGTGGSQAAEEVWQTRMAVCEGYANLFQELCSLAGIESRVVKGYVKTYGTEKMHYPNHAWNSVKVAGSWKLLDVTWASMNNGIDILEEGLDEHEIARKKLDYFFLIEPQRMILTHLPEDPLWQLQGNEVSMEVFLQGNAGILLEVQKPQSSNFNFEAAIEQYEQLDSLDKHIALLERMVKTADEKANAYGLGIAYYYKAQSILKESTENTKLSDGSIKNLARRYYQKAFDQLNVLQPNDFGYEFSRDLLENVAFKIEVL